MFKSIKNCRVMGTAEEMYYCKVPNTPWLHEFVERQIDYMENPKEFDVKWKALDYSHLDYETWSKERAYCDDEIEIANKCLDLLSTFESNKVSLYEHQDWLKFALLRERDMRGGSVEEIDMYLQFLDESCKLQRKMQDEVGPMDIFGMVKNIDDLKAFVSKKIEQLPEKYQNRKVMKVKERLFYAIDIAQHAAEGLKRIEEEKDSEASRLRERNL